MPDYDLSFAPQTAGVAVPTPEDRERAAAALRDAPPPVLGDIPAALVRGSTPPLILSDPLPDNWRTLVAEAIPGGRAIVGPMRDDTAVARAIAVASARYHEAEARRARDTVRSIDNAPVLCPGCGRPLEEVRQGPNSPLNREQFDSVKAGEFYCSTCPGDEGKTGFKYYWRKDLSPWKDAPPEDRL